VKLLMTGASPYARKVLVLAWERGLREQIELVVVNPHERPAELVAANPLSKVPTLIADDGSVHVDSFAICLYLDTLGNHPPLALPDGPDRWSVLQRHALANGILDCSVSRRVESLKAPEPDRLAWMERQAQTADRVLDRFESQVAELGTRIALDTITLACALSYLDFRFAADDWRVGRPRLAAWHTEFEKRPSMQATRFPT
jgi:glutathione S-transferase